MFKRMICILLTGIMTVTTLTGCWDKVEIDQRGFVGTIMIDMASPEYMEKMDEMVEGIPGVEKQSGKMLKVTYALPDPRLLGGEGGGGGGDEKGFITMSSVAMSIPKTNGYVDSRLSRRLYFGHTQVVILGEELLKNPDKLKEVIDLIDRSARFNRTAKVFIIEGEASKVSEVKPKGEKLLFRYIRDIMENEVTNGRIVEVDFNKFVSMMRNSGNGILPRMTAEKEEIKIAGIGLIKDFKLIGYLSEYDTLFFNSLLGKRRGGREYLNLGDIVVTFSTSNTSRVIKLLNKDIKNLEIAIKVNLEGAILNGDFENEVFDSQALSRLENEFNKMAEDSSKFVIKKLQKDYKTDALMIGDYLQKYHPGIWEQVKDDWDEVYPKIKITPIISHKIRRIGEAK